MIGLLFLFLFASAAEADSALPERAQQLVGKFAALNGPNCWNSALYGAGLVSGIRHVDYEEFTAWLESPLCREISEKEASSGEIVALRRMRSDGRLMAFPYTAEIHGYLLLAPGLAFTKNGTMKGDGFEIQDTASLHAKYETANRRDCRMLGLPKELCLMKAQYFRCAPDSTVSPPAHLKAIEAKVESLEAELHRLYTGKFTPASLEEEKARLKQAVDSLQAELDAAAAEKPDWQTELLRLRLVSARILQF